MGYATAAMGCIVPSFLNLTVVKFSLQSGKKPAFYLIGGFATVLFVQANIGAYLASVVMKNSEYITIIQKIGTVLLLLLSFNFFRLHVISKNKKNKIEIKNSRAYLQGVGMALLNTFSIPFYFTAISFLIGANYFEYSVLNSFYFSLGSTAGSFSLYAIFAIVATKIERKLSRIATKMDFILGCLTGGVAFLNFIYLL